MKGKFKPGGVPLGYEIFFEDEVAYHCDFIYGLGVVRVYGNDEETIDIPANEVDVYDNETDGDFEITDCTYEKKSSYFNILFRDLTH